MKVAIITAGGAGMFCGSCMQDNTLARTLRLGGVDAVLVPTYTPIRVDEENVSEDRVLLGGINVYLDSVVPGWKWLPQALTRWLDRPGMIRSLSRFGSTDASKLGALTLDMLNGETGPQRREFEEFARHIRSLEPDVVIFSNALLSGVLPALRQKYTGPVLCLLQGDDIFLEALAGKWKARVIQQVQQNCRQFDGFLTHSQFYRNFMSDYLTVDPARIQTIPLSIDTTVSEARPSSRESHTTRIGYFARICHEKGIQNLLSACESFLRDCDHVEVIIAGYLPRENQAWFQKMLDAATARAPGRVLWLGSPESREEKFEIIRSFDFLCVPTAYREPKGLYVLEAALHGIPAIVPRHGAFPELIDALGSGILYDPNDSNGLKSALASAANSTRDRIGDLPERVRQQFGMETTAKRLIQSIQSMVADRAN